MSVDGNLQASVVALLREVATSVEAWLLSRSRRSARAEAELRQA